jgi:hypothetical protein
LKTAPKNAKSPVPPMTKRLSPPLEAIRAAVLLGGSLLSGFRFHIATPSRRRLFAHQHAGANSHDSGGATLLFKVIESSTTYPMFDAEFIDGLNTRLHGWHLLV